MKVAFRLGLMLALGVSTATAQSVDAPARSPAIPANQSLVAPTLQSPDVSITVEVFPVLELPVAINNPVLIKTKGAYLLKCSLANSSEFRQLGLRYSLALLDSSGGPNHRVISRNEGFALAPYQTRSVTFKTPLTLNLDGNERLVLMLQQVISTDYMWDVINPKKALAAYITGDYSITPQILRVKNQVDAPPLPRVIY